MQQRFIAYALFTAIIACSLGTPAVAQTIPSSTIQGDPIGVNDVDTNRVVEEKLVLIAMARPSYDAATHARNNATHQLSKAKNAWLNLLALTTQFNETDFEKPPVGQTQYVYPKYFFGVTIPIGILFSQSSDVRIARENQFIARDEQEELARTIRAQVVGRYRAYVIFQEELRLESNDLNDELIAFKAAQKDFRDGKLTLEAYNTASRAYTSEVTRKLGLELQSDAAKTDLEQSLGMPLEDALRR